MTSFRKQASQIHKTTTEPRKHTDRYFTQISPDSAAIMSTEKTETKYQLAQPTGPIVVQGHEAAGGVFIDGGGASLLPGQKQGHKCCGGCCDVRRAVIIVNVINMAVLLMGLFSLLATKALYDNAGDYDDDEVKEAMELYGNAPLGSIIGILVVQIVISALGAVGAFVYNKWMVGMTAAAYFIGVAMGLIALNPGSIVYNLFFAYPHFFLIKEIHQGSMTKETYPDEKQSCCCV